MKYIDDSLEIKEFLANEKAGKKVDTFILTRFNLHLWKKDKHNRNTLSNIWMEQRFELFEKYCFPSVMNQKDRNFIWLCLFDISTLCDYKTRIIEYSRRCPEFFPLFLDDTETSDYTHYITKVIKHLKNDNKILITIRLDNDDALNLDYVSNIRHCLDNISENTVILSFKYGIQYYVKEQIAVHIPFYNNHFLAMVDKMYDKDTIYQRKVQHVLQFNHFDIKSYPYPFICNKKDRGGHVDGSYTRDKCQQ